LEEQAIALGVERSSQRSDVQGDSPVGDLLDEPLGACPLARDAQEVDDRQPAQLARRNQLPDVDEVRSLPELGFPRARRYDHGLGPTSRVGHEALERRDLREKLPAVAAGAADQQSAAELLRIEVADGPRPGPPGCAR
jgi:hypothetical protein